MCLIMHSALLVSGLVVRPWFLCLVGMGLIPIQMAKVMKLCPP